MSDNNKWRGETGGVLVETIVSAVVIALVVLAVFASIDASSRSSGREKARSVAMSLAEQDQERLRGMKAEQLLNLQTPGMRSVLVSGVTYTVESEVDWFRDAGTTPGCTAATNDATKADYLKIRSAVTWPSTDAASAPVTLRSTVNKPVGFAPSRGTLAVKVVNRAQVGVPNLPVTITGGAAETTNAAGCAIFDYIYEGAYDVTLNQPGWVNVAGENPAVSRGVRVTAGKTNVISVTYDRAGSAKVGFSTCLGGGDDDGGCSGGDDDGPAPWIADAGHAVSVAHPSLPTGARVFAPTASPTATFAAAIDAGSLFPHTSPYAVYSGRCASQNPETYIANYFASQPGRVQVSPGGGYAVTVKEPALKLKLFRGSSTFPRSEVGNERATVVVTLQGTCKDTLVFSGNLTASSQIHPNSSLTPDTSKRGTLKLPGLPFGVYDLCVDDGTRFVKSAASSPARLTSILGPALRTLTVPTADFTGTGSSRVDNRGTCAR